MPPKGKKGQDKGKSGEEEREDPLQAVVWVAPHVYTAHRLNSVDTCGSL
jgi:hypothetical protein